MACRSGTSGASDSVPPFPHLIECSNVDPPPLAAHPSLPEIQNMLTSVRCMCNDVIAGTTGFTTTLRFNNEPPLRTAFTRMVSRLATRAGPITAPGCLGLLGLETAHRVGGFEHL